MGVVHLKRSQEVYPDIVCDHWKSPSKASWRAGRQSVHSHTGERRSVDRTDGIPAWRKPVTTRHMGPTGILLTPI
ncbi:hypothetical protein FAGKG844_30067 [Frankia sp. AgKG'84/4]